MSDREIQARKLDPRIGSLLARLRWRIRAYVWLHGLALALVWLGATYWIALALDYLPVLAGATEMPRPARTVVLGVIAAVLAWILYRWVLRRTLVPLTNRNMALLLERRFRGFDDRLLTAVELSEDPQHAEPFDPEMLRRTAEQARDDTGSVRLREVFNFAPLAYSLAGAALFAATVAALYTVNRPALALSVNRIYLLGDQPWPRNARIEVAGVELVAADDVDRPLDLPLIPFDEHNRLKVARGSNLRLRVRADLAAAVVPDLCTLHYRTVDGERGRVSMNRLRRTRDQYQDYAFNGRPLRGILSSVHFDVVGYDYRVRDYTIEVVDSPTIIGAELDCRFPDYLVDQQLALWLPRTVELTSATQLPRGTDVTIRAFSNKPLQRVDLYNPQSEELVTLTIDESDRRQFVYHVPALNDDLALEATLYDVDNVVSQRPHRIFIAAVADEPPRVDVRLQGIGSAVTPDVIIPIDGTIMDDYAVDRAWFDVQLERPESNPEAVESLHQAHEFSLQQGGRAASSLDFRELRSLGSPASLQPEDTLTLTVKAADKHDLDGGPNIGRGDRYQLDVVTPEALLAILESREIGLRRRFEHILQEMTEARDWLNRVRSPAGRGLEPDDLRSDDDDVPDPQRVAERVQTQRLLRTQQALQQCRKSEHELLGVATAFLDVREELINNRVDTEDRKTRLKELIADPLQLIGETMFPELDRRLEVLETALSDAVDNDQFDPEIAEAESVAALDQANDILAELEQILQQMLDLETFNELLDIVRQLIDDQQRLIQQTEAERREGLLRDLQ